MTDREEQSLVVIVPLTPEQTEIYAAVRGKDNVCVRAVAGSGKTTTVTGAIAQAPERSKTMVAFNKHSATDLEQKLDGAAYACTMHSAGFAIIRKKTPGVIVDADKARKAFQELHPEAFTKKGERNFVRDEFAGVLPAIDAARTQLLLPDDPRLVQYLLSLGTELGEDPDVTMAIVANVLNAMNDRMGVIDYLDMIYRPVFEGWVKHQTDVLAVDEAQDLNPCQHQLVFGMAGRHIVIGDERQAIMNFAGADCHSMMRMRWQLEFRGSGLTDKPLTCCWRCPTSGLDLARILVPQIRAAPNAIAGEVLEFPLDKSIDRLKPNDLVICRNNAPLVGVALRLIRKRMPCLIRGKNIGDGLVSLVKRLSGTNFSATAFLDKLDGWFATETKRLDRSQASEDCYDLLADKRTCLHELATNSKDMYEVAETLEAVFSDDNPKGKVCLSSVHRSKGLEADHVTVIDPGLMPRGTGIDYEQNVNLLYVALTRHKKTINLVEHKVRRRLPTREWLEAIAGGANYSELVHKKEEL